jgi:hypothetical protein
MAQTNVQVFSGNVGIGTTSPSYKLDNNHNSTRLAGVINYTKTASSVNSDTYVYIGRFTTTGVNTVNIYCSGNSSFSGNYATFIRHYDQIPTVPYLLQGDLYTTHKFYYQIVDVTSYDVWHRQTTLPGLTCTYYISGPSVDLPSEPAVTNRLEFPYGHIAKQGFSSGITTNSFNSRVGIGITSPGGLLDIRAVASDPSIPTVHIGDNAADYGDYGMVNLVRLATESGSKAHLAFIRSGNTVFCQGFYNDTNTFGFWPSFGSVTNTPAMSFATNGNVGIGTTDPSQGNLTVQGLGADPYFFGQSSGTYADATDFTGLGHFKSTGSHGVIRVSNSSDTAGSTRIDFNTRLGGYWGTNSVLSSFFRGTAPAAGRIMVSGETGDYYEDACMTFWTCRDGYDTGGRFDNLGGTGSLRERMRITSTGNVGIGTNNPTSKLQVHGDIQMRGDDSLVSGSRGDNFSYDGSTMPHYGILWRNHSAAVGSKTMQMSGHGGIRFFTQGNERMTIRHSGAVGIGTADPGYKLDVPLGNQCFINGVRFFSFGSNTVNTVIDTGIPMRGYGGGGSVLLFFSFHNSSGDQSRTDAYILRKSYDASWVSDGTSVHTICSLRGGSSQSGTLSFGFNGSHLTCTYNQGGAQNYYALSFDNF